MRHWLADIWGASNSWCSRISKKLRKYPDLTSKMNVCLALCENSLKIIEHQMMTISEVGNSPRLFSQFSVRIFLSYLVWLILDRGQYTLKTKSRLGVYFCTFLIEKVKLHPQFVLLWSTIITYHFWKISKHFFFPHGIISKPVPPPTTYFIILTFLIFRNFVRIIDFFWVGHRGLPSVSGLSVPGKVLFLLVLTKCTSTTVYSTFYCPPISECAHYIPTFDFIITLLVMAVKILLARGSWKLISYSIFVKK